MAVCHKIEEWSASGISCFSAILASIAHIDGSGWTATGARDEGIFCISGKTHSENRQPDRVLVRYETLLTLLPVLRRTELLVVPGDGSSLRGG